MKVTVAYRADDPIDTMSARTVYAVLRLVLGKMKVKESDRHPPFRHLYLTTRKPGNPDYTNENTCNTPGNMV
jgi:hypothetical protein